MDGYFASAGLLSLATACVYFGSYSSLPAPRNSDGSRPVDDIPERVSSEDALLFPIIGAVTLLALFFSLQYFGPEWINFLLGWYFAIAGVAAVWKALIAVARWALGEASWRSYPDVSLDARLGQKNFFNVSLSSVSACLLPLAFVPSAVYMLNGRSALLTNVLGVSFATAAIAMLKIDSFSTGCIMLSGLFFYDVYFVFYSAKTFGQSVMVKVATSVDVPIKLLWPRSVVLSTANGFSMLGLGDIVVPGVFVALALRYDHFRAGAPSHTNFKRPYFYTTLAAYVLGLLTTVVVMHTFQSAQPALLYLSPAGILSVLLTSFVRGELGAVFAWSDVESEPVKSKSE
ncbi:Sec7-like domain belongs to guanine nucleotide exchange factors [Mycena chlorophos]|uniref:Sec7-like domain belongs to guanine nucleotide exchange factors n=1 Tax=Mycena chlorophos TaxID=658473 RepID=A0A8H6RWJ7_MYCCL|nr:Sec7-like domain belongs to guanine nucleotide exchange factors [Mycena chlorophos]